jgi:hypothetical protein
MVIVTDIVAASASRSPLPLPLLLPFQGRPRPLRERSPLEDELTAKGYTVIDSQWITPIDPIVSM